MRKELSLETAFRIPPQGAGGFGCAMEGRALRTDEGIASLPEVHLMGPAAGHDTIAHPERDAVVAIWSGRTQREWASVPAFIQLAEQLATCHAPGALINRALKAGDDEVRHAVLSGGIASYYDGGSIYADGASHETRLPVANRDGLRRLAVESWLDGCIGEGTAAAFAAQEAKTTEVNAIRNTQQMIAEDEAQHAELAWDVLDWTLEVGGDDIRQLVWELRDTLPPSVEEAQTDMSLRRYGCLSYDVQKSDLARHHEHAQKRLAAVLAA